MSEINNIVIFGATGNTGLCALQQAVDMGYNVTAFVRDSSKVPDLFQGRVNVIVGDVTNSSDVDSAMSQQDAVVICLGTRNALDATTLMSDGTRIILESMGKFNVRKVSACISSFLFWDRSKVPEKYIPLTEDHERMLEILQNSDLEWIAILPPQITEKEGNGCPVIVHDKGPGRTISKYDLGKALVDCLSQPEHYRHVLGICDNA